MAQELTLEQMADKIDKLAKLASDMHDEMHKSNEENKEEHKANDEEKKIQEAKKARRAKMEDDMRKAMDEKDDEKREAAMRKAMKEYDDEHKANDDEESHDAASHDEHKEHIASIINDKKIEIDNKILGIAKSMNPNGVNDLAKKLKSNTFSASKKMYDDMIAIHGSAMPQNTQGTTDGPTPYFMAGIVNPADIDNIQLNASSPTSEFATLSTQEILEMQK